MNAINGSMICSIPTLRLHALQAGSVVESKKLLRACQTYGFFYLDLSSSAELCKLWKKMLTVSEEYFNQALETKLRDCRNSDNQGYEPTGTSAGAYLTEVDAYESLKISRREMLQSNIELSSSVRSHSSLFFEFIDRSHAILMMLLQCLSTQMDLKCASRFEEYHKELQPSLSTLALLRYPKHDDIASGTGIGHNKHTDLGSLTFLLCEQWGLQILSPDNETWMFVEPRPNHAVVNVGDSLRFISGSELASVVHRVLPLHGKQHEDRHSIAYFLRMDDEVNYHDASGKAWSAKEWHDFKFNVFRQPLGIANGLNALTGGMEKDDMLLTRIAH